MYIRCALRESDALGPPNAKPNKQKFKKVSSTHSTDVPLDV